MNHTFTFLIGLGTTILFSIAVILYLRKRLETILIDLCGTHERAKFWLSFSTVFLVLTPFIFAMTYQTQTGENTPLFFEFVNQLRCGLSGIAGSLVLMGFMVTIFIILRPIARDNSTSD